MAQLVEQRIRNAWVRGSSPLIGFEIGRRTNFMDQFKNLNLKDNKNLIILIAFAVVFLAAILVGALVFHQPMVAIVVIMLLQVAIAVCLHNAELWLHGSVIIIELVIGILASRISTVIIGVILYAGTICALRFLMGEKAAQ